MRQKIIRLTNGQDKVVDIYEAESPLIYLSKKTDKVVIAIQYLDTGENCYMIKEFLENDLHERRKIIYQEEMWSFYMGSCINNYIYGLIRDNKNNIIRLEQFNYLVKYSDDTVKYVTKKDFEKEYSLLETFQEKSAEEIIKERRLQYR